jgi:superfamily I DNA and RNA helicase
MNYLMDVGSLSGIDLEAYEKALKNVEENLQWSGVFDQSKAKQIAWGEMVVRCRKEGRRKYQVWVSGYRGMCDEWAPAYLQGEVEAESFRDACNKLYENDENKAYYDPVSLIFWCLPLHDNEADARRACG